MAFKPEDHFMKMKGNDYLPVAWRVVWVREEHPDALIDTEVVYWDHEKQEIMVRAVVVLPKTGARATGHCVGTLAEFKFGYVEKCETQAVGRALALLGYGTAFAGQDLDEGERVADSPTAARNGSGAGATVPPVGAQAAAKPAATVARAAVRSVTAPVPQSAADPHADLRQQVVSALKLDTEAAAKLPKAPKDMSGDELEKTFAWLATRAQRQVHAAPEPTADEGEWPRSAADWSRAQVRQRIQEGAGVALKSGKEWKALAHSHGQPDVASSAEMTQAWLLGLYQAMRAAAYAEAIAGAGTEQSVVHLVAEALSLRDRRQITAQQYGDLFQSGEARKAALSAPLLSGGGGQGRAQVAS